MFKVWWDFHDGIIVNLLLRLRVTEFWKSVSNLAKLRARVYVYNIVAAHLYSLFTNLSLRRGTRSSNGAVTSRFRTVQINEVVVAGRALRHFASDN